jgi:glycosyltransferase involved in cell wall biosynthesis
VWKNKTVTVVFPAYNEEDNVAAAVKDFAGVGVVDEILVVNNNSHDRTAEHAAAAGARVVEEAIQGYGVALRRGLREATGDFIILAEPDGTFLGRDVIKLLSYADDFDLVCGTRTTRELIWDGANMG